MKERQRQREMNTSGVVVITLSFKAIKIMHLVAKLKLKVMDALSQDQRGSNTDVDFRKHY